LRWLRCATAVPAAGIKTMTDGHLFVSEAVVEEKEKEKDQREDQDTLGPLRPLTLSKSAPTLAAVLREAMEKSSATPESKSSSVTTAGVHKSASATPLSLLVKASPPPTIKTEGLYQHTVY